MALCRSKAAHWDICSVPTRSSPDPLEPETTGRRDVSELMPLERRSCADLCWRSLHRGCRVNRFDTRKLAEAGRGLRCFAGLPDYTLARGWHGCWSWLTLVIEDQRGNITPIAAFDSIRRRFQEYPDRMLSTFSILPSPKVCDELMFDCNLLTILCSGFRNNRRGTHLGRLWCEC